MKSRFLAVPKTQKMAKFPSKLKQVGLYILLKSENEYRLTELLLLHLPKPLPSENVEFSPFLRDCKKYSDQTSLQ